LVWANSPWAEVYQHLLHVEAGAQVGPFHLVKSVHHWINDGVMAVFFFAVGLELKREVAEGELSTIRKALLPAVCAVGGMVVPALVYTAFNVGTPTIHGWGVPMATDIAFALGLLALLGDRVPVSYKVLLTAIAVADDLGAIVVIALFYTADISTHALLLGLLLLAVSALMNTMSVRHSLPYLVVGIGVWLCFLESGVHATIAAVGLAFTIPARTRLDSRSMADSLQRLVEGYGKLPLPEGHGLLTHQEQRYLHAIKDVLEKGSAPLQRIEHALMPAVTFVVLPLFALANTGVQLGGREGSWLDPVPVGVVLGLVVGKPLGIWLVAAVSVRLRVADLPGGMSLTDVAALGALCGVGFTMSLFIGSLAFPDQAHVDLAKMGTLTASVLAGVLGLGTLAWRLRARPAAS
jgi:NhaA family Na+:H+ antiporter